MFVQKSAGFVFKVF